MLVFEIIRIFEVLKANVYINMRKQLGFVLACLMALASCGNSNLERVETGKPYIGLYQGRDVVVVFDQTYEGNVKGRVYLDDGTAVAAPMQFSTDLGRDGHGMLYLERTVLLLDKWKFRRKQLQGEVASERVVLRLSGDSKKYSFAGDYKEPQYEVFKKELVYAKGVRGFWSGYSVSPEDNYGAIYIRKLPSLLTPEDLDLDLDLYQPIDVESRKLHPLLVLIHGGAFYGGDKRDAGFPEMAEYFAQRGYVVASINYRLGFWPWCNSVDRAGYRAVQDANAAVRYLLDNREEYCIDTANIFVAGSSAGAVTALNLAFMSEGNRPESTYSSTSERFKQVFGWVVELMGWDPNIALVFDMDTDLGKINSIKINSNHPTKQIPFRVKAVVNMWGAMHDLAMLNNSKNTAILSFHGDADQVLPYESGYPFGDILNEYTENIMQAVSFNSETVYKFISAIMPKDGALNEFAFRPMYGSKMIDGQAQMNRMRRSELNTAGGGDHSLHLNSDGTLSDYFYDVILPKTSRFLCEEMIGGTSVKLVQTGAWFEALSTDNVDEMHWQVDGGAILERQGDTKVKVMLFGDEWNHKVQLMGKYKNGVEFCETIR